MTDFEREDLELKSIMGDKFQDVSEATYEERMDKARKSYDKVCKRYDEEIKNVPHETEGRIKARDAEWHPIKERNWKDDLKDSAKSTALFGGLNLLIWYWEIAGLMDESVALPCMLVCALLAGLGIGKVVGKR